MNIKYSILWILLGLSFGISAQTLSGDYQGLLYNTYYIGKYDKGVFVLIDSVQLDAKGTFVKSLSPKLFTPNTLYVVASAGEYNQKKSLANPHPHASIRFVYTGEDVSYQTSWRQETGYLKFIKGGKPNTDISELNTRLQKTQALLGGIESLMLMLENGDPFYNQLIDNYILKASTFNAYCQSIAASYPKGSYMNVYALMYQQVVPLEGMSYKDFQSYRSQNFFQFTDLRNPLVANVPMLPAMYRSYLYHNQPVGVEMSGIIQKMQDDAKAYIQKNACAEVLQALNMQDFRPQVQVLRERFIKELNFDTLYLNKEAWFSEINEVLGAYDKSAPYHQLFGKDMITALERTLKPEAYTKLAEAAFSITEQFNWGAAQTELVDYLTTKSDERLLKGSGKVAMIYAMKNVRVGSKAPDIVLPDGKVLISNELATNGAEQTLLVFFASDCGHCEEMIQQLKAQFSTLQARHIRVIAIAADTDVALHKKSIENFPWQDTYCDFKGISGVNFKAYAVPGTPTLILLHKNGTIVKRTSSLVDIFKTEDRVGLINKN